MSELTQTQPSLLDLNLDDCEPIIVLPDNTEARLRIERCEIVQQKKDASRSNLAIVMDLPDHPMADDLYVWLPVPDAAQRADDPKSYTKSLNRIGEFCSAFSIRMPLNPATAVGLTGWAVLSEKDDNRSGLRVNDIRRFIPKR